MPTPRLGLPFIAQGQAQKEIAHNEALLVLDIVAGGGVLDRDLAAPPASPSNGDAYIVGAGAAGSWAGHADELTAFMDGSWRFVLPTPGMMVWAIDEGLALVRSSGAWVPLDDLLRVFTSAIKGAVPASGGGTTAFLRADGNWAAPAGGGGGVTDGDKGDITVASAGAVWTIDADAVTNAKLANMPSASLKGNNAGAAGDPLDLSAAQATALLDPMTSSGAGAKKGLVPAPPLTTGALLYLREDGTWADFQNLPRLGINTTADATNKLSVKSNAVLVTALEAAGGGNGDVQIKINKEAAADTASFLFQAGFSGRAEIGLTGDDDFHFKVSADGAAWTEAMLINRTTGIVTLAGNSVGNAALADMATARIKGRATAGTGDPEDLTAAQATALLNVFTSTLKGLAPASGGGTTSFLRADGTWATPAGGGSGDVVGPASSTDNALARFDLATGKLLQSANVTISDAGEITHPLVSSPLAAPADAVNLFGGKFGGRMLPAFRGPSGLERPLQPFLGKGRISRWAPAGGSTISLDGAVTAATGTATSRVPTATRYFTAARRLGYVSAATAGASAGAVTLTTLAFWRGNAAGLGGFHGVWRFGISDAAAVADARLFAGFTPSAAAIGNVNPSTLLNIIGVGCDNAQTTLRIMHNDGAGTATAIDLGANFPANTLSTDFYELHLSAAPNDTKVEWMILRLNTGDVAAGTITTDLPAVTQFLAPQVWRNNGAAALAVGVDIGLVHIETEQ